MSNANKPDVTSQYAPTSRSTVKRLKKRAVYDKAVVHAILDEALICHVGFVANGNPFVIPTIYARDNEAIYLHGAVASRMLKEISSGIDVCITVTLIDGLVLARSAFHHSMNYRSVMIFGTARLVTDEQEKLRALKLITNHIVPNRWDEVRAPNKLELRQTNVLALPLAEVSAKVRNGPPVDDEEDYSLPIWAGVIPIRQQMLAPKEDGRLVANTPMIDLSRFESKS